MNLVTGEHDMCACSEMRSYDGKCTIHASLFEQKEKEYPDEDCEYVACAECGSFETCESADEYTEEELKLFK